MEGGNIGLLSKSILVNEIKFREVESNCDYNFHNSPQRRFLILLDGLIEIETSLGDVKQLKGGDVLLLEDTTGKGHKSRYIIPIRRKSIFFTLR